MGTDGGVILRDLARKAEIGFLPIGYASHMMFEPTGDLLTNGTAGVLRWAIRADLAGAGVRIGPPRPVPSLPGTDCGIATDRTGRIVAVAAHQTVRVWLGDRSMVVGPLDDCRGVALSPDGKWLATSNHGNGVETIWSLPDARVVKLLGVGGISAFSPDGRWLVTCPSGQCRIWEVGSWREAGQIEGYFQCFSPDGRLGIIRDKDNVLLRLFEFETGRVLARLERPDQRPVDYFQFSPDGSRLVGTTLDPPGAQVIDLRAIRRGLAVMGLDWAAPAFPAADPARADLPPMPPLVVDHGFLGPGAVLLRIMTPAADALDFETAEPAIANLEAALAGDPANSEYRRILATSCNNLAWHLAEKSGSSLDLGRALKFSLRAVELSPGSQAYLNTQGVVLYRAGRMADAVTTLGRSLEAGKGQFDGYDLFFLAMAHHRLGHVGQARSCLDRALGWVARQSSLTAQDARELADFRAQAEAVLAGPIGELPEDVFEEPGEKIGPIAKKPG